MHILPKHFMRVQHYGATSRRKGTEYLAKCRKMLGIEEPAATQSEESKSDESKPDESNAAESKSDESKSAKATISADEIFKLLNSKEETEKPYEPSWTCTKCGKSMECIEFQLRRSWKIILPNFLRQTSDQIQTTLWTASELHSLRESTIAAQHSTAAKQSPTGATQGQKSSSRKTASNPAIMDSS